jgi:hypothetical protein
MMLFYGEICQVAFAISSGRRAHFARMAEGMREED